MRNMEHPVFSISRYLDHVQGFEAKKKSFNIGRAWPCDDPSTTGVGPRQAFQADGKPRNREGSASPHVIPLKTVGVTAKCWVGVADHERQT